MSQSSRKALLSYSEKKVKNLTFCEKSVVTIKSLFYLSPLGKFVNPQMYKIHWDLMEVALKDPNESNSMDSSITREEIHRKA